MQILAASYKVFLLLLSFQPAWIRAFVSSLQQTEYLLRNRGLRFQNIRLLSSRNDSSDEEEIFGCYTTMKVSREEAQRLIDDLILRKEEYDKRIQYGGEAQGFKSTIVTGDDPRGAFTYGEFPTSSMDELVDLALTKYMPALKSNITMIDLGSGCGRLVLYSALTRGFNDDSSWKIMGIEISKILHDEALRATLAGLDNDIFEIEHSNNSLNQFVLNLGSASEFPDLLQKADIIFAYSTTWDNAGFSEKLGAIVMSQQWNELLSSHCRPGTVVITIDRALDPNYGWKLVDRLDVENREVFGSTGYIHVLQPES